MSGPIGKKVSQGQFGASTMAINGALECKGPIKERAKKRFQVYKKVLVAFHVTTLANEKGCYNWLFH